jgi:Glycosyltransferase family 87
MKALAGIAASGLLLLALALLPLPLRPYLDFQVIYHADLGLLRGIPLYDHAGQVNMIAELAQVPPEQVFVLPFPYPPWYALSTLWLALVPIHAAARLWFGLSLILLIAAVWLLIGGRIPARRLPLYCLVILWVPVLGSLFVGQYAFPVLLGAALLDYALRKKVVVLTALAAALLTFKPHLGGLALLLAFLHLLWRRDEFGRRALLALLLAGVALFAIGYLVSPQWPQAYLQSLTGFRDVSQCHQCVSLSMIVAGAAGGGLPQAVWISAVLAILAAIWLVFNGRRLNSDASQLVTAGVLLTFLISPYLQNYDYLLLLVPFLGMSLDSRGSAWLWLVVAFVVPLISLALLGTAGNAWLVFSAVVLLVYFVVRRVQSGSSALPA